MGKEIRKGKLMLGVLPLGFISMQTTQAPPSILHRETSFLLEGKEYKAILLPSCMDPLFVETGCESVFQTRDYHAALEAAPPGTCNFGMSGFNAMRKSSVC
jgi:hypothetical protein